MGIEHGAATWKEVGDDFDATFDTTADSPAVAYLEAIAARKGHYDA